MQAKRLQEKKLVFAILYNSLQNIFAKTFEKIVTFTSLQGKARNGTEVYINCKYNRKIQNFHLHKYFSEIFGVWVAKHFLAIVAAPCPAYSPILDLSLFLCL
jgi:hypothetical protein